MGKFLKRPNFRYFIAHALMLAILGGSLSLIFSPEEQKAEGLVYCPLTHQMQPVSKEYSKVKKTDLDDFCLTGKQKIDFAQNFAAKLNHSLFSTKKFEDLIFDYLKFGKVVFNSIPGFPTRSDNELSKVFVYNAFAGSNQLVKIVWKSEKRFSLLFQPRPPTFSKTDYSCEFSLFSLESISRNINPRSPPFSV